MLTDGTKMTTTHRSLRAWFAGFVAVVLIQFAQAQAQEVASAGAAPLVVAPDIDGRVFCNGVRRQDEIVVVNTRMLGCSCDPESIRTGLVFENYAVVDDSLSRRWQSSDLGSFLAAGASDQR